MRPDPTNLKPTSPPSAPPGTLATVHPTCVRLGWIDRLALAPALHSEQAERTARAATAGSWVVGTTNSLPNQPPGKKSNARVVLNPWVACTTCDRCRAGLSGQCLHAKLLGTPEMPGGLSGRVEVPTTALHPIPDALDDEVAVFAPLIADVAHMLQQVAIRDRNFVTILGDTPLALIAGQVLARHNKAVRVLGDNAEALSVGDRWGIKHRPASEAGLRNDQDVVVLCDRAASTLERALGMVRPRGELVLKSTGPATVEHAWPAELIDAIVRMELRITGSWLGSPRIGLAMLDRGEVDVLPLIARRIDPATAIALLSEAPTDDHHQPAGWTNLDRMVVRFHKA